MSTKRAMEHLQGLIELDERAEMQISALTGTLKQVVAQMDAVLEDADQPINEVLAEQTTGKENKFSLSRDPVKVGSVTLKLNTTTVAQAGYTVAGNVITLTAVIPAGKKLSANYITLGLKAQTAEIIKVMDDFNANHFVARKAKYQQVIQWMETQVQVVAK